MNNRLPSLYFNKIAFTLAEVLIVIGIIGIIAQATIPTLVNDFQTQVFKTSYKKAFSVASQALLSANTNNLTVARTAWVDETSNRANFDAFKQQFTVTTSCDTDISKCWDMTGDKAYGVPAQANTPGFIDNSGFAWIATNESGGFTGGLVVDTNGFKKPNKYGKDRFLLGTSPNGVPMGGDNSVGVPEKIVPWGNDYITPTGANGAGGACPSGGCYYTSWLYN